MTANQTNCELLKAYWNELERAILLQDLDMEGDLQNVPPSLHLVNEINAWNQRNAHLLLEIGRLQEIQIKMDANPLFSENNERALLEFSDKLHAVIQGAQFLFQEHPPERNDTTLRACRRFIDALTDREIPTRDSSTQTESLCALHLGADAPSCLPLSSNWVADAYLRSILLPMGVGEVVSLAKREPAFHAFISTNMNLTKTLKKWIPIDLNSICSVMPCYTVCSSAEIQKGWLIFCKQRGIFLHTTNGEIVLLADGSQRTNITRGQNHEKFKSIYRSINKFSLVDNIVSSPPPPPLTPHNPFSEDHAKKSVLMDEDVLRSQYHRSFVCASETSPVQTHIFFLRSEEDTTRFCTFVWLLNNPKRFDLFGLPYVLSDVIPKVLLSQANVPSLPDCKYPSTGIIEYNEANPLLYDGYENSFTFLNSEESEFCMRYHLHPKLFLEVSHHLVRDHFGGCFFTLSEVAALLSAPTGEPFNFPLADALLTFCEEKNLVEAMEVIEICV